MKHSEKTKKLIGVNSGKSRLGKKRGHYKTISGDKHWQFKKGAHPYNFGIKNPELSERNRRRRGEKRSKKSKEKTSISCKNKWKDPNFREMMLEKRKNQKYDSELLSKLSKARWENSVFIEKQKESRLKSWENNEERKTKASKRMKQVHAEGKIDHSKRIKNSLKSCAKHPNKQEKYMDVLIQFSRPSDFIFSGDGEIIIGGKNPDWFNINGKKQVIEFFGSYWHEIDDEEFRKSHFAKYGYDCLVIWDHELKDQNKLIEKIRNF